MPYTTCCSATFEIPTRNLIEPLVAEKPDGDALRAIAGDPLQESRIRILAYNRLREIGAPIQPKQLLGMIVEYCTDEGLDVLAAYADGEVRYINRSGGTSFFLGPVSIVEAQVRTFIAASQQAVDQIGPWTKARLAPPPRGVVRMTFLVSDGLYFGQGLYTDLWEDPMGRSILGPSEELLKAVVQASLNQRDGN
jgi:hypothetical protein